MKRCLQAMLLFLLAGCGTARYYIVRHAEKGLATAATTDVPLTDAGSRRAEALAAQLKTANISRIFSTGYNRTRATAQPLSTALGIAIEIYKPADTLFIKRLKELPRGNVFIVGHSNTVDDLVNSLTGRTELNDLPETAYGDLFVVTKRGKRYRLTRKRFGL